MPRQFGAGGRIVIADVTVVQTAYLFPPSCTTEPESDRMSGHLVERHAEDEPRGTSLRMTSAELCRAAHEVMRPRLEGLACCSR